MVQINAHLFLVCYLYAAFMQLECGLKFWVGLIVVKLSRCVSFCHITSSVALPWGEGGKCPQPLQTQFSDSCKFGEKFKGCGGGGND